MPTFINITAICFNLIAPIICGIYLIYIGEWKIIAGYIALHFLPLDSIIRTIAIIFTNFFWSLTVFVLYAILIYYLAIYALPDHTLYANLLLANGIAIMPAQEILKSAQQPLISLPLIMAKERHPNIITSATTLIILSYLFVSTYIIIHFICY